MPWFRVDDELHDHGKSRRAGKAAMGVWVMAGSWSMARGTDGFIPEDVLPRWGTRADAGRLVAAGFWFVDEDNSVRGWRFHDWFHFQPSAETTAAWRAAESEAGQRGNHTRWHTKRGVVDPNCPFCYRVPDHPPDQDPDQVDIGSPIGSGIGSESPVTQSHTQDVSTNVETSRRRDLEAVEPPRADVERICEHLADRIEANGSKRPAITQRWRDAARRTLDRDGRTEQEIHGAIEWSQADEFWRSNILSMPTLREKYDQIRLQAQRRSGSTSRNEEWRAMQERQMARAEQREREMGLR